MGWGFDPKLLGKSVDKHKKIFDAGIDTGKDSYRSDKMIQSLDRAMTILSILEQKKHGKRYRNCGRIRCK